MPRCIAPLSGLGLQTVLHYKYIKPNANHRRIASVEPSSLRNDYYRFRCLQRRVARCNFVFHLAARTIVLSSCLVAWPSLKLLIVPFSSSPELGAKGGKGTRRSFWRSPASTIRFHNHFCGPNIRVEVGFSVGIPVTITRVSKQTTLILSRFACKNERLNVFFFFCKQLLGGPTLKARARARLKCAFSED